MTRWEVLLIAGMAAVTFGVRYPVLALVSRLELPPSLVQALRFIPPAVLAAIIAPALVMPGGVPDLSLQNAYLVAGAAAAVVAWRTRNLLLTIGLGMAIFWLWRLLT